MEIRLKTVELARRAHWANENERVFYNVTVQIGEEWADGMGSNNQFELQLYVGTKNGLPDVLEATKERLAAFGHRLSAAAKDSDLGHDLTPNL